MPAWGRGESENAHGNSRNALLYARDTRLERGSGRDYVVDYQNVLSRKFLRILHPVDALRVSKSPGSVAVCLGGMRTQCREIVGHGYTGCFGNTFGYLLGLVETAYPLFTQNIGTGRITSIPSKNQ